MYVYAERNVAAAPVKVARVLYDTVGGKALGVPKPSVKITQMPPDTAVRGALSDLMKNNLNFFKKAIDKPILMSYYIVTVYHFITLKR